MLLSTDTAIATAAEGRQQQDSPQPLRRTRAYAERSYRPDIDGIRAIAVLAVAAYHAFPRILTGGFLGVDVFFVISGYLITQLILGRLQAARFTLGEFYRRRVRRIVPALLVVLVVFGAVGWYLLLPGEFRRLSGSMTWSSLFLANVLFARHGQYFDPGMEVTPMLHLWSLGVEEQFYLSWPILLLAAFRRGQTRQILVAVVASSLAISVWGARHGLGEYFFQPAARAWELGAGGLLATFSFTPAILARWTATVAAMVGFALVAGSIVMLGPTAASPGAWPLLPCAGTLLLIAAGPRSFLNRRLLASPPLAALGQISYPLYLWHWPLLSFAMIVLGRPVPPLLAAALLAIACIAAYMTFRFIECPIRFGAAGPRAVPWLLAGLGLLAIVCGSARWLGIPARLSGPAFTAWEAAITPHPGPFVAQPDGLQTARLASRRPATALIIGDSHAENLAPRVQRVIAEHPDAARSAVFAIRFGCPPVPDLDGTPAAQRCSGSFARQLERAQRADVDTVIFSAFWESYFMKEFAPLQASASRPFGAEDRLQVSLGLDSSDARRVLDSFQRTLAALIASGRKVYIVLSNPTSPELEPLFLLPASARLAVHPPQRIEVEALEADVDATAYESYVAPLMQRLREIANHTGAKVLDPRATLCNGMSCPAVDSSGVPTHLDSNHLTFSYARERAGFIDAALLDPDR